MPSLQLEFSTTLGQSAHAGEMHHTIQYTTAFAQPLVWIWVLTEFLSPVTTQPRLCVGNLINGNQRFQFNLGSSNWSLIIWHCLQRSKPNRKQMISSFIWRADPTSIIIQETCGGLNTSDGPAGLGGESGVHSFFYKDDCCRFSSQ